MIYLFYGNDNIKSRDKYNAIITSLLAKNSAASLVKLNSENFNLKILEELTMSQGLFYQKSIIGGDNLFSITKTAEDLLGDMDKWLARLRDSSNIFILLENNSDDKIIAAIKKYSSKDQGFLKKEVTKEPSFSIFSLTDAFVARKRQQAWSLYQEALLSGCSSEEILWKLIWQINNLLLVKGTKNEAKLKLKPFVLAKAKAASKNFSADELRNMSASFLALYHENYLGTDEFDFGLEKIILSV